LSQQREAQRDRPDEGYARGAAHHGRAFQRPKMTEEKKEHRDCLARDAPERRKEAAMAGI
jgi:hypothetical protein